MRMLFVIQNMKRSEESVALLERLYRLSPEQYDIDVRVLSKRGKMLRKFPAYVRVLKDNEGCIYDTVASFSDGKAAEFVARQIQAKRKYLFLFGKSEKGFGQRDLPVWTKTSRYKIGKIDEKYKGVNQKKNNGSEDLYAAFDQIHTANFAVKAAFLRKYPALSGHTFILPETIHWDRIERLARCRGGFADTDFDGIRILSIEEIGIRGHFDLALVAARELKKRGFYFRWYLIGNGIGLLRLKVLIRMMGIEDCVFLLGKQINPYPYIGQCDLYAAIGNAGKSAVGNVGNAALGNVVSEHIGIEGALILDKYVIATDDVQAHCRMLEWEEDALLVEPLPNVFADAIEYLTANS